MKGKFFKELKSLI